FQYSVETLTVGQDSGVTYLAKHAASLHLFTGSRAAADDLAETFNLSIYDANAGGAKALLNNEEFVQTREEQMQVAVDRTLKKFYGVFADENGQPEQSGIIFVESPRYVTVYYAALILKMKELGYAKFSRKINNLIEENEDLTDDLIKAKKEEKPDFDKIRSLEEKLLQNSRLLVNAVIESDTKDKNGRLIRELVNTAKTQTEEIDAVKNNLEQKPSLAIVTNIGSTGMDIKYRSEKRPEGPKGVFTVDTNDTRSEENDYQAAGRGSRDEEHSSTSDKIVSAEQVLDNLDADKAEEHRASLMAYAKDQADKKRKASETFQNLVKDIFNLAEISLIPEIKNVESEVDVIDIVRYLDAKQAKKYLQTLYGELLKKKEENADYKTKFDIDFADLNFKNIGESSKRQLETLQILSYLNDANLYNDIDANKDSRGFYRRERSSITKNSALSNLLSHIQNEKTESDSFQADSRDRSIENAKTSTNMYSGVESQRDRIKNQKYMGKDWLLNVLQSKKGKKATLSKEDIIKLGKKYATELNLETSNDTVLLGLGIKYLEELRKKCIEELNRGYAEILYQMEEEKDAINEMYSNKILSRFKSMVTSQKAAIAQISRKYTNSVHEKDKEIREKIAKEFEDLGITSVKVDTKMYKEKNTISKIFARIIDIVVNKGAVILTTSGVALIVGVIIKAIAAATLIEVAPVMLVIGAIIGAVIIFANIYLRRSKVDRYEAYKQQKGGFEDISAEFVNTGNLKLWKQVLEGGLYKLSSVMGKIGIYAPAFAFIASLGLMIVGGGVTVAAIGVMIAAIVLSAVSLAVSVIIIKINSNKVKKDKGFDIESKAVSDMKDTPSKMADKVLGGLIVAGISSVITAAILLVSGSAITLTLGAIVIFTMVSLVVSGLFYIFNYVLPAKKSNSVLIDLQKQKQEGIKGILKTVLPSFVGFAVFAGLLAMIAGGIASIPSVATFILGLMFVYTFYGVILKTRDEIKNAGGKKHLIAGAPFTA
ncbi:MAG: hypothetical protein II816_03395, partial [Elusimicrobia bacterium]|nr:hypothetical protein [Elusimicrobiota bacterium]